VDSSVGVLVAVAAALGLIGVAAGWSAPRPFGRYVASHRTGVRVAVATPLLVSIALAAAYVVVQARQGTCPRPLGIAAGESSASLCQMVAPWLRAWAVLLGASGLAATGGVAGASLRRRQREGIDPRQL